MSNFTKGEWKMHKTEVYLNNGYVCVECEKGVIHEEETYRSTERESIANANLIAAAPEMYEMLEKYVKYVEYDRSEDFLCEFQNIVALLTKARGDS